MRSPRFVQLITDLLTATGHPDIVSVAPVEWPGVHQSPAAIRVEFRDGSAQYLRLVSGSGPSGTNWDVPEEIPEYEIPRDKVRFDGQSAAELQLLP